MNTGVLHDENLAHRPDVIPELSKCVKTLGSDVERSGRRLGLIPFRFDPNMLEHKHSGCAVGRHAEAKLYG